MRQFLTLAAIVLLCQTAIRAQEEEKQLNSVDTVSFPPQSVVQKPHRCALGQHNHSHITKLPGPQLHFEVAHELYIYQKNSGGSISSTPGLKRMYLHDTSLPQGHCMALCSLQHTGPEPEHCQKCALRFNFPFCNNVLTLDGFTMSTSLRCSNATFCALKLPRSRRLTFSSLDDHRSRTLPAQTFSLL